MLNQNFFQNPKAYDLNQKIRALSLSFSTIFEYTILG